MRSKRQQKNFLMTILLVFTVFLYGCGGSAGVENTTMRFEMLDITTKAPVENVQLIINGTEPNTETGQSTHIRRQLATDSRGVVTFSDLPPDRQYTIAASKDGYILATNDGNDAPSWVPNIDLTAGYYTEQGKSYTFVGYMRRSNSPTTGSVKGYIKDRLSNQPIMKATVYITPAQADAQQGAADVIDTTNKPSKPVYYELNDVPSGQQTLRVVAPGYQAVSIDSNFVIPAGGTIQYDIYLDTSTGTINATIIAKDGDTFVGGYTFMAQVLRNGTEIVSDTVFTIPDAGGEGSPIKAFNLAFGTSAGGDNTFTGPAVPVLPSGSSDTYTIKITSDQAHMVNPANGLTGITMNVTPNTVGGDGPVVNAGAIYMAVERGQISVTLYQIPYTQVNLSGQNDTTLREQAQQASIVVVNGLGDTTTRYTGESPDRYFHYLVENMPVGRRSIIVNFPGHTLTDGDNTVTGLLVLKDRTSAVTRSINWITN